MVCNTTSRLCKKSSGRHQRAQFLPVRVRNVHKRSFFPGQDNIISFKTQRKQNPEALRATWASLLVSTRRVYPGTVLYPSGGSPANWTDTAALRVPRTGGEGCGSDV
jgi:hypothetical protein